jgi:hypothetical protein
MSDRQPFEGTPSPWLITGDLLIVGRDPFNGELSALNRTPAGVVIADLKASLRPRAPDILDQLDSQAIRMELAANARLIMAGGALLCGCRTAYEALAQSDFYGPRRGRILAELKAAIAAALSAPLPALDEITKGLQHGNL